MIAYTDTGLPAKNMLIGDARRRGRAAYVSLGNGIDDPDPIGTAFFLDVPWGKGRRLTYAVTARHCIEGIADTIYIEGTDVEGKYRKIPTTPKGWLRSDTTDVACHLLGDTDSSFFAIDSTHEMASGTAPCGLDVYMIGLFAKSPRRYFEDGTSSIEPIVRFGKLSLPRTEVPVYFDPADEGKPEKATVVSALLVECISFEGESGSPVFMYEEHTKDVPIGEIADALLGRTYSGPFPHPRPIHITDEEIYTPLLGLISSHWKVPSKVRGRRGKGQVGLNSGIAIIIPAGDIRDFIMNDEKVKEGRERIPQGKPKEPASPLSARPNKAPEGEFTKEDFENALKKASRKLEPEK